MRKNAISWGLVAVIFTCLAPGPAVGQSDSVTTAPVQVTSRPLDKSTLPCVDVFVAHVLPHITAIKDDVVKMFDANGSGVAAGDLDGDGDIDLVLGNQDGSDTLLWNDGPLAFRKEEFSNGNTRDVKLVDVDGDGRLDVVLTRKSGTLNFFHNEGDGKFKRQTLPGVAAPAYLANWADLDRDGDLDLVTATYDAGLLTDHGNEYIVTSGNKGVYYYENKNGRFSSTQLSSESQALAMIFPDLNGDGWQDILVGNDFLSPDMIWLHSDDGWQAAQPFEFTTHSTMSLDQGDVNRDGVTEIFAADMKPYSADDAMDMMPVMDDMMEGMTREQVTTERQTMENMLQMQDSPGHYLNMAPDWSVDGTGWSWSSKFGDLDNDGWLDLYSVNGMIEERLFAHMPRQELVEENQAFRNEDGLRFRRMPSWDLDGTYSGRGMVMVDFDEDGDLDIVINNLRGPAQLYENLLCTGDSLEVDLRWPDSKNTQAIGANVKLYTDKGILLRDVRAGSGYLSGDTSRLHFGLPAGATLDKLEIIWPDGATSTVEKPVGGDIMTVTRQP